MRSPTPAASAAELALARGAAFGAAVLWVIASGDFAFRGGWWSSQTAERLLLGFVGAAPEFTFRPVFALAFLGGYRVLVPLAVLMFAWPRARSAALRIAVPLLAVAAAVVGGMAVGVAYVLSPVAALVAPPAVLPLAIALGRTARWPLRSTIAVGIGVAAGTLVAQGFFALPFQDAYVEFVSPWWGFAPPALLGAAVAAWVARRRPRSLPGAVLAHWGLAATIAGCLVAVGSELHGVRVQTPWPAGIRVVDDWAYDVYITGEPPQLVWTDRKRIHVWSDPYGGAGERYTVDDDEAYYVERIWGMPGGGFYIQGNNKIERWNDPSAGERLSYRPALRFRSPAWLRYHSSSLWTVAEDPERRRVFTVSEYFSRWGAFDLATGDLVERGSLSSALWPFWHFTTDLDRRQVWISSALDDGGLYTLDLDRLELVRRGGGAYLYETALAADGDTLWGVRPLTGEVVAVDTSDARIVQRIPVRFGLRDLQLDRRTGTMFTCSEFTGEVFRIDGRSQQVTPIAWCGRLCRSMHLDVARDTLWVATRDGVCRVSLAPGESGGQ